MTHLVSPIEDTKAFTVWFTQGFSSQRELLLALQQSSLRPYIRTIASHQQNRDEILSVADLGLIEPKTDRYDFVLKNAIAEQVQLVLVSHHNHHYEQRRDLFEQQGITLLTGTRGVENHQYLEDKFKFTQICQQAGIAVVNAIQVNSTEQLKGAILQLKQQQQAVCVKPVVGVFAQGFWELRDDLDYFHSLIDPASYQANTQQFIDGYDQQQNKRAYLVMPFLSGDECSVDLFCVQGKVISMVTRIKKSQYQEILPQGPCDGITRQLAELFNLDGIVNAQFRQDDVGKWHVLEINARPSGGIGMTLHSEINLVAECVAYYAQRPLARSLARSTAVRAVNQSVELNLSTDAGELHYA